MRPMLILFLVVCLPSHMFAQNFDAPPLKTPDAATLEKVESLKQKLNELTTEAVKKLPPQHQADLQIYAKSLEWITRHQDYFTADIGKQMMAVAEQGIARANVSKAGKANWLNTSGKSVAKAYRSKIDDSVQPYAVWYPVGYAESKKPWRIDVMLHGRDSSLTEVKFLNSFANKNTPKDRDYIQIEIYGRGNNAYRWAAENDVFEALEDFIAVEEAIGRGKLLDTRRVVLKGFSMGGAGTWHLGLRHPDRFVAIQPGAGFTTTHGYIGKLPERLPFPQEELLTIYDAVNYAGNAANVSVVAYSGEIDKQRQAAVNIENRLEKLGLSKRITHFVAPGLEHKYPPDWQKKVEAKLLEFSGEGKSLPFMPDTVDFTTYTLKNAECHWVRIDGLVQHYEEATVKGNWTASAVTLKTKNVRRVTLTNRDPKVVGFPNEVSIDGVKVSTAIPEDKPSRVRSFVRSGAGWKVEQTWKGLEKRPGVQGPIDDAFTHPFICVVGTGKPLNPKVHEAALAQLDRFQREWDKNFRGQLKVVKDTELTPDIADNKSLILFGDPGSNLFIAQLLPELQIEWTKDKLSISGKVHDARTHLPMLIRPLPCSIATQYVVINSGHTFHQAEFNGTNALLYPRLGDFAIVQPKPTEKDKAAFEVIENGLYDEFWKVRKP